MILVIDDEKNIRQSLKGTLEDEGYTVDTAESAEKALNLIADGNYKLIILDVLLPGMNGIEFLKKLREENNNIYVMVISGHATVDMAVEATKLGAYNFLEKPLNPDKLLLEVKNIFERIRIENEIESLRKLADADFEMVGNSTAMKKLREEIVKAAPTDGRVFIEGENGTGKELVARAIHRMSNRRNKPFVKINCAAIPKELIESELFGFEKGAFTGASFRKIGRIEEADTGTLFLDEVGDMSLDTQAKLLRVLEENELLRLGSNKPVKFDVRIISATNKNIMQEIDRGNFREDLYFRLKVIPVYVPPLRERKSDIPLLVNHFLRRFCGKNNKRLKTFDDSALELMKCYSWPGNIRELKNIVERAVIMSEKNVISEEEIKDYLLPQKDESKVFKFEDGLKVENKSLRDLTEEFQKKIIEKEFIKHKGNVSAVASSLKIDRANLHRKLKKFKIK
ncbi:sigma-54-dependent Fis family transcriptional regulator [candidate division KSB1 bacterium]|nr:MAG: sigma-54-dependent Fis family transcriptional regulator [candidate division KSB1 bacterium]